MNKAGVVNEFEPDKSDPNNKWYYSWNFASSYFHPVSYAFQSLQMGSYEGRLCLFGIWMKYIQYLG